MPQVLSGTKYGFGVEGNTVTEVNAADGTLAQILADPSYGFTGPDGIA
jgi:hypothetical protein